MGGTGFQVDSGSGIDAKYYETKKKELNSKTIEVMVNKVFSPDFLVFIIVLCVLFAGINFIDDKKTFEDIKSFWQILIPIITTYIGYAIGSGKNKLEDGWVGLI